MTILNSTLTANTARGGHVFNASAAGDGYGGAVFNLNGTVTIRYSTLADNLGAGGGNSHSGGVGSGAGGAVYNLYLATPGSPAADAGTAATMTVQSSILAGSTDGTATISDCENNAGTFTSGHDVVETEGSCSFSAPGDQNADPQLVPGPATANGGPTPTLALQSTSPAIGMGGTNNAPAVDQRGNFRNDGSPDVGAYEFGAVPLKISGLPDVTVLLGTPVPDQNFTLSDNAASPLGISFASSNATVLPASSIGANSGCGSDASHYACTLSLVPNPGQVGSSMVTVAATDPSGYTAQESFVLTIQGPIVGLSASALDFGTQTVGGSGVSQTVTLTNAGNADLDFTLALSGTAAGDYSQAGNCPNPPNYTLTAGSDCSITLTFTPTVAGTRAAALTITSNAPSSPDSVALSGVGNLVPPVAYDLSLTTYENEALGGTLPASGPNGDPLSYAMASAPTNGGQVIITGTTGAFTYTPANGYHGNDSFTFTATDTVTHQVSNAATVTITVNPTPPPNTVPPVASNLDLTTYENEVITGTLPAAVTPASDTLNFTASAAAHGTVTLNAATGAFTYTPTSGYSGSDSFTFTATDTVTNLSSTTATVSITVNATPPPNPVAPVASNLDLTTYENVALTGTLPAVVTPAADTLVFALAATTAAHGTVAIANVHTGAFTYTPDSGYSGGDSFTFTATDTVTGLVSNTATVALTIEATPPPNPVPPVANGIAVTTYENEALTGTLPASVTPASDALSFAVVAQPAHGMVSITNASTGAFTYTPNTGFNGSDSFTFEATDTVTGLTSNIATIAVTVNATPPPNPVAPVANDMALTGYENEALSGTLPAAVTPSADTLVFALAATTAAHGTVAIANVHTGAFTYTPDTGFHGTDAFTFTATDTVTGLRGCEFFSPKRV